MKPTDVFLRVAIAAGIAVILSSCSEPSRDGFAAISADEEGLRRFIDNFAAPGLIAQRDGNDPILVIRDESGNLYSCPMGSNPAQPKTKHDCKADGFYRLGSLNPPLRMGPLICSTAQNNMASNFMLNGSICVSASELDFSYQDPLDESVTLAYKIKPGVPFYMLMELPDRRTLLMSSLRAATEIPDGPLLGGAQKTDGRGIDDESGDLLQEDADVVECRQLARVRDQADARARGGNVMAMEEKAYAQAAYAMRGCPSIISRLTEPAPGHQAGGAVDGTESSRLDSTSQALAECEPLVGPGVEVDSLAAKQGQASNDASSAMNGCSSLIEHPTMSDKLSEPILAAPREGVDFNVLPAGKPFIDKPGIEVAAVFSHGCEQCDEVPSALMQWRSSIASDVRVVSLPYVSKVGSDSMARGYLAAESMRLNEDVQIEFFNAVVAAKREQVIVERHEKYNEVEFRYFFEFMAHIENWYVERGADRAEFAATLKSDDVTERVRNVRRFLQLTGVRSSPAFIVNGKYRVAFDASRGIKQTIDTLNYLIELERTDLTKNELRSH